MRKTLTEQWRNVELPNGRYYVKDWDGTVHQFLAQNKILWRDTNNPIYASERIEVLEPVPSYDEFVSLKKLEFVADAIISGEKMEWENIVKRGNRKEMAKWINERKNKTVDGLQKKLDIATKTLKEYANKDKWHYCSEDIEYFYTTKDGWYDAEQALKEMEGVK